MNTSIHRYEHNYLINCLLTDGLNKGITRQRIRWTGFLWDWRSQTVKSEVEAEEEKEEEEEEDGEEKEGEEDSMVVMMIIMMIITILFPVSLINSKYEYMGFAANSKVHFHIVELQEIEKEI